MIFVTFQYPVLPSNYNSNRFGMGSAVLGAPFSVLEESVVVGVHLDDYGEGFAGRLWGSFC